MGLVLTLFIPIMDFIDCVPKSTFTDLSLLTVLAFSFSAVPLLAFSVPLPSFFCICAPLFGEVVNALPLTFAPLEMVDFATSSLSSSLVVGGILFGMALVSFVTVPFAMGVFFIGTDNEHNFFEAGRSFDFSSFGLSFLFFSSFVGNLTLFFSRLATFVLSVDFAAFTFPDDFAFLISFAL